MSNERRRIADLGDEELDAYANDTTEVAAFLIETFFSIADKYGVDRDDAIRGFSRAFLKTVWNGTFKDFETEGEPHEEPGHILQ